MLQNLIDDYSRLWLDVVRQQAIAWTNVDQGLWCHMVSLNHSELTHSGVHKMSASSTHGYTLKCLILQHILMTVTDNMTISFEIALWKCHSTCSLSVMIVSKYWIGKWTSVVLSEIWRNVIWCVKWFSNS